MVEHRLDCMGEACPIPLMKTEKELEKIAVGDLLIVSIDHSCAMKNVPEMARNHGHEVEIEETGDGEWDIYIVKTK